GLLPPSISAGAVTFTSTSLPGGVETFNYSTNIPLVGPLGNGSVIHDAGAASDIAAQLDLLDGISATSTGNVITVTWDNGFTPVDGLVYQAGLSSATTGTLDGVAPALATPPIAPILEELGSGFEALETVLVDA